MALRVNLWKKSKIYSGGKKAVKKSHVLVAASDTHRGCRHTACPQHRPCATHERPSVTKRGAHAFTTASCSVTAPPALPWAHGGEATGLPPPPGVFVTFPDPAHPWPELPASRLPQGQGATARCPQTASVLVLRASAGWQAGRVSSLRRSGLLRGHRRRSPCHRASSARWPPRLAAPTRVRLTAAGRCPGASVLRPRSRAPLVT